MITLLKIYAQLSSLGFTNKPEDTMTWYHPSGTRVSIGYLAVTSGCETKGSTHAGESFSIWHPSHGTWIIPHWKKDLFNKILAQTEVL